MYRQLAQTVNACVVVSAYEPADVPAAVVRRALAAAMDLATTQPGSLSPPPRVDYPVAPPLLRDAVSPLLVALHDRERADPDWVAEATGDVLTALTLYARSAAIRMQAGRAGPCRRARGARRRLAVRP